MFRDIPICCVVLALVVSCSEPAQSMPSPLKGGSAAPGARALPLLYPAMPARSRCVAARWL